MTTMALSGCFRVVKVVYGRKEAISLIVCYTMEAQTTSEVEQNTGSCGFFWSVDKLVEVSETQKGLSVSQQRQDDFQRLQMLAILSQSQLSVSNMTVSRCSSVDGSFSSAAMEWSWRDLEREEGILTVFNTPQLYREWVRPCARNNFPLHPFFAFYGARGQLSVGEYSQ